MRRFVYSLSGENNLVPFHLWRRKIVLKSVKSTSVLSKIVLCEGALAEKEQHAAMMGMAPKKALGNDELTKEFYSCFWEGLK